MSSELVPVEGTRVPGREKKLVLAWLSLTVMSGVVLPFLPMSLGIMLVGIDLGILLFIAGLIVLVVAAAATKGDAISPGSGWVVGIIGFVLLAAGIAIYALPPATTEPGPGPGGGTAMNAYLVPSVDTTASRPASPYTACTSLTLQGISGQTGVGVIWAAANAVYSPDSATSGHFLEKEAVTTTVASGAASFLSAECFQMSFTFQYKQVPSIQGVLQKEPYMLKVDSIGYTVIAQNNQTTINAPVFATQPSGTNAGDWMLLIMDKNSAWHPACGEFSQQGTLPTGGCNWVTLGTNDGTTVDTVVFDVIIDRVGPFGYDTVGSPVGKQDVINFEIGLPQGQVGSTPGYYMPSWTFALQIQRNS